MREFSQIAEILTSVLCSVVFAVGMGAFLFPGNSLADTPSGVDDLFMSMDAVGEEELAESRGGAVLPNGMTVEVTGLMRVMVDGQHLSTSTFGAHSAGGLDALGPIPLADAPASLVNSLNGISLDQYREINFHISNLPANFNRGAFVPRTDVTHGLIP